MGREYELKFRADSAALAAIEARYGPFDTIAMATTYYDTAAGDLARRRWTLRLRLENGRPVCTAKLPLADGSRGEWEAEAPTIAEALPMLTAQGAPALLLELPPLEPVCGARFTRRSAAVTLPQGAVELALDQGVLFAGQHQQPLSEVEVELKKGPDHQAAAFAQTLAAQFQLTPEPKSKAQRAFALRGK